MARTIPPLATDAHMHVFGPASRYPYSPTRSYTTPDASIEEYLAFRDALGLGRVVFVQPSAYAIDNRCLLDAMARTPGSRAVVVVPTDVAREEVARYEAAGARGVRINWMSGPAAESMDAILSKTAERIKEFGWHIQVYFPLAKIVEYADVFRKLPVDVVFDHMGHPEASLGTKQPGFDTLLGLLREGKFWVKLSGAYRVSNLPNYADTEPVVRALIEASPDRCVFATDWPHTGKHAGVPDPDGPVIPFRTIDNAAILRSLGDWAGDDATFAKILVANPAKLYRF